MISGLKISLNGTIQLFHLVPSWFKRVWRKFTSSASILWLFTIVLVVVVLAISYGWNLKTEQTIGALAATLVAPLAFLSQRSVLREDQRQKMRYEAYTCILPRIEELESVLAAVSVSELHSRRRLQDPQNIRISLKDFTNTYHSHEMVFITSSLSFKYLHFSLMSLTKLLDDIECGGVNTGYGDDKNYSPEAGVLHQKCKDYSNEIASYFFDLKKDLIESLGFAKLNGSYIEERKPLDKKYKLLREVATKDAVDKLEKTI